MFSNILAGRMRHWSINKVLSSLQAGLVDYRRTTDHICVMEAAVDRNLRAKTGSIY
jgi:hypothetical protein